MWQLYKMTVQVKDGERERNCPRGIFHGRSHQKCSVEKKIDELLPCRWL